VEDLTGRLDLDSKEATMKPRKILLDIATQRDFFVPSGNCYTPKARSVAAQIGRLFAWAAGKGVPVVSTLLRFRPGQNGPLCERPHCIDGTTGEKKLPGTVLPRRIDLGLRNVPDLPRKLFDRYQQVIFEMRQTDIFAHSPLERLITELGNATFIVCGVGVGQGIAEAVIGLRTRGFPVILASDAVIDTERPDQYMPYERMEAKGALLLPTAKIIAPPQRPRRRARAAAKFNSRCSGRTT